MILRHGRYGCQLASSKKPLSRLCWSKEFTNSTKLLHKRSARRQDEKSQDSVPCARPRWHRWRMRSVCYSDFCNRETPRIRWSVEIPRGNQRAHNYRQRACSPGRPDNARSYIARSDRHKNQKAFRKAIAPRRRKSEFPRCGCRRKQGPDRNENRSAYSFDRLTNDRLRDSLALESRFPGAIQLPDLPRFPDDLNVGRLWCRCRSQTRRCD
jgi:hypothetical protein